MTQHSIGEVAGGKELATISHILADAWLAVIAIAALPHSNPVQLGKKIDLGSTDFPHIR